MQHLISVYHIIKHGGRAIVMKVASRIKEDLECFKVVVVGCYTKETDVLVSLIVMTIENVTKLRALYDEILQLNGLWIDFIS